MKDAHWSKLLVLLKKDSWITGRTREELEKEKNDITYVRKEYYDYLFQEEDPKKKEHYARIIADLEAEIMMCKFGIACIDKEIDKRMNQ